MVLWPAIVVVGWFCLAWTGQATASSRVEFLDEAAAREVLSSRSVGGHREPLSALAIAAKTSGAVDSGPLDKRRRQARQWQREQARGFTPEEKRAVRWYVAQLHPILERRYPLLGKLPWRFLKGSDQLEGGLMHTRGKFIVLPEGRVKKLLRVKREEPRRKTLAQGGRWLLHEQMHVFERLHAGMFDPLYRRWGFLKAERIRSGNWVEHYKLPNPDALEPRWVYSLKTPEGVRWIWPMIVLKARDGIPRLPLDMQAVAVELERTSRRTFAVRRDAQGSPAFRPLYNEKQYLARFPGVTTNLYHPEEILAEAFANAVVFHALPSPEAEESAISPKEKAFLRLLEEWFGKHLG